MKTIILILSLSLLVACGEKKPTPSQSAAPVAVSVQTVAPEDWPLTYEATGTVRARASAVISSRVMGYVREVRFQAGDYVRAGQLLVVIEAKDLDAQRAQAEREKCINTARELANQPGAQQQFV